MTRPIAAIMADLSRPLPEACVAVRQQDGQDIRYLHWWIVADLLDAYAPGWDGEITRCEQIGRHVVIGYRLRIPCAEGWSVRDDVGFEYADVKAYGDPYSNAKAMAMCRAAAQFGVRWLYAEKDGSARALQAYLRQTAARKRDVLQLLGVALDERGIERGPVIEALRRSATVIRNADIPLEALQGALALARTLTPPVPQDTAAVPDDTPAPPEPHRARWAWGLVWEHYKSPLLPPHLSEEAQACLAAGDSRVTADTIIALASAIEAAIIQATPPDTEHPPLGTPPPGWPRPMP